MKLVSHTGGAGDRRRRGGVVELRRRELVDRVGHVDVGRAAVGADGRGLRTERVGDRGDVVPGRQLLAGLLDRRLVGRRRRGGRRWCGTRCGRSCRSGSGTGPSARRPRAATRRRGSGCCCRSDRRPHLAGSRRRPRPRARSPSTRNGWRAQLRPRRYRNALIGIPPGSGPHGAGRFAGSDDAPYRGLGRRLLSARRGRARARSRSLTWNFGTGAPTSARSRSASSSSSAPRLRGRRLRPRSTPSTVWHTASDRRRSRSRGRCGCGSGSAPSASWIRSASVAALCGRRRRGRGAGGASAEPACARNRMCGLRSRRPASRRVSIIIARRASTSPVLEQRPREPRVERADEAAHADLLGELDRFFQLARRRPRSGRARSSKSARKPSVIDSMTGRSLAANPSAAVR